ncbi:MAG: DNA polymerase III subunit beta, partial [Candidatus Cloacimonetes bacterium]|nr:DNA polymerase III subunit beta [Candidatus Cloacimonadota bacterium]
LLTTDNNEITITANNIVSTLTVSILGDIIELGSILIDKSNFKLIKKLSGILNIISSDNMGLININTEEEKEEVISNTITIKANRSLKFNSILPEQYPEIPTDINSEAFVIPENVFKDKLKIKVFSAKGHFREVFNGVLISEDDMVANNTHYLAKYKLNIENKCDGQMNIPMQSIEELDKILNNKSKKDLQFYFKKDDNNEMKYIKIVGNDFVYTTRLIDGVYPDYKQVIPNSFHTFVDIKKDQLQDTLEFAMEVVKDDKLRPIYLNIAEQLTINTPQEKEKSMSEVVPSEITGEELGSIKFNSGYMNTILKVIDEDVVNIKLGTCHSPAVFTGENNEDELYILVPMRLIA